MNISLIVNDDESEQCVRALHQAFFESNMSDSDLEFVSENGNGSVSAIA